MEKTLSSFHVPIDEKEVTQAVRAKLSGSSSTQPEPTEYSSPSAHDYFRLRESVFHTIQVLQKTKSAFRSKDLAGLRKYLEEILRDTSETLKSTCAYQPINPLEGIELLSNGVSFYAQLDEDGSILITCLTGQLLRSNDKLRRSKHHQKHGASGLSYSERESKRASGTPRGESLERTL